MPQVSPDLVLEAWEHFVRKGEVLRGVEPAIARSWQRRRGRLDPLQPPPLTRVQPPVLDRMLAALHAVGIEPGVYLSESVVGTMAPALALTDGQPVQVAGFHNERLLALFLKSHPKDDEMGPMGSGPAFARPSISPRGGLPCPASLRNSSVR